MEAVEKTELQKITVTVDKLTESVAEIRKAILGDEFNTKGGYKQRLESIESRVENVEDFITKWKWILVGAIGLGGYGGLTFVQQLIQIIGTTIGKK